jgi:hypothetical protein
MKWRSSEGHWSKSAEKQGSHAEQFAMTYYIMIMWSKFIIKFTSCLHTTYFQ